MTPAEKRFLICGMGSIGRRHLGNLKALGQSQIMLFRTGKSTLPDEELEGLPVEQNLDSALEHWHPDGVIIANPTAFHLDMAIPAARAGCHLLLEKPISHTMTGVRELLDLVQQNQLEVLVGFQFRFHPGLRKIKQLLDEGQIGQPLSARVHWGEYLPGWHPWEDYRKSYSARPELGGGVVLTLCHPFDYLRWFLGEVKGVSAAFGSGGELGLEVETLAETILEFESGALASVHLNYHQRPPRHSLEIVGTQGTLHWDNADGGVSIWNAATEEWVNHAAPEGFERNQLFMAEMEHFIDLLNGRAASLCTLEDGARALQVALAVHKAAEIGNHIRLDQNGLSIGREEP